MTLKLSTIGSIAFTLLLIGRAPIVQSQTHTAQSPRLQSDSSSRLQTDTSKPALPLPHSDQGGANDGQRSRLPSATPCPCESLNPAQSLLHHKWDGTGRKRRPQYTPNPNRSGHNSRKEKGGHWRPPASTKAKQRITPNPCI